MNCDLKTRKSLLSRLRNAPDDRDWQDFYNQYRQSILSFCRKRGLDEFAAADVLQETMVLLIRKLPEFEYNPDQGRFRNWLLKLVSGKIGDSYKRTKRARLVSIEQQGETADFVGTSGDEIASTIEDLWQQALLEEALRRIKSDPRTKTETFMVFQSYVVKGGQIAEVAREFGMKENAVYQIKNRMMRRLTAEVSALEENTEQTGRD